MAKVSIKDIAKEVGVSKSLVSIVLNNRGDELSISKETQKKVQKAAKDLNYRPNQLARSLRLQKSNTVGLILPNITDRYFTSVANNVEKCADKNDYHIIICNSHEDQQKELKQIQMLIDRGVDGLIIAPSKKDQSWIEELNQANIPFVLIDRKFSNINTNYVIYENYQGAFNIISHLLELGYTKIAQLTLLPYMDVIAERDRGYREALQKYKIRYSKKNVQEISLNNMYENVKRAMQKLLSPPLSVEAIFTHNNVLAEYVLDCATELRLRIPRDFALVSFGDQNLFKSTNPSITCVSTPDDEIGENAMHILMNSIKGNSNKKSKIVLPTGIVLRESCGRFLK